MSVTERLIIVRNDADRDRFVRRLQAAKIEKPLEFRIRRHRRRRSLAQNDCLHGWMRYLAQAYGEATGEFYSPEAWKEYFRQKFLGKEVVVIRGESIERWRKTSELNVTEMRDLLEKIDFYCAGELNILLPRSDDYFEAMKGKVK